MKHLIAALGFVTILSGCDNQATQPAEPAATPSSDPNASGDAADRSGESPGNGARSVAEETDDYLFEYAYPSEAGRIDALAALLDARLEKTRTGLARGSAEARQQARADGFPYNKHSFTGAWELVADLPDWLSLSLGFSTYEGGAHGNHGFDSLVWNKPEGRAMEAMDLFTSSETLDEALGEQFCAALNAERARRRGAPVAEGSDDPFDQCVKVEETTILVGSSSRRAFDRIGILVGPYVAGPYAEGTFEFTFPVDRSILAAVKPEYRASFRSRN